MANAERRNDAPHALIVDSRTGRCTMDNGSNLSIVRIAPVPRRWQPPGVSSLTARVSAVLVALLALVANATAQEDGRGIQLAISDDSGRVIGGYRQSYALLIGVSDYTAGWPDLESVPSELAQVENVLTAQGFKVVKTAQPGRASAGR
jgi:hypothetical protein